MKYFDWNDTTIRNVVRLICILVVIGVLLIGGIAAALTYLPPFVTEGVIVLGVLWGAFGR